MRTINTLKKSESTPLTDLLNEKYKEYGYTLESLGKAVGGHHWTTVTKVLKGKMKIPLSKIEPYAHALHIKPLHLLELVYPECLAVVKRCLDDKSDVKDSKTTLKEE